MATKKCQLLQWPHRFLLLLCSAAYLNITYRVENKKNSHLTKIIYFVYPRFETTKNCNIQLEVDLTQHTKIAI
jgi:hypothetical protein